MGTSEPLRAVYKVASKGKDLRGLGSSGLKNPAEHQAAATDLVWKWVNFLEMQNIISAEGRYIS